MFKLICIILIICITFSHSQHFVLFKNGYTTSITTLLTTTKKTLTQCLTACTYQVLCYAVSIEKTQENNYECSLYEILDFDTINWEVKPNTKVFVKILDSCLAYRIHGFTKSGVYNILPDPEKKPFEVWCDMVKEGGGWTVLMRRESNKVLFEKNWDEYKNGFGKLDKSFWLGNDKIHEVTTSSEEDNDLKVDLISDVDESFTARYNGFRVSNETTSYTSEYKSYNQNLSNAVDRFTATVSKAKFSTYDRDNDVLANSSCSERYGRGGWWFTDCHIGYMTGRYMMAYPHGNSWGKYMRVKNSELKIRKKLELLSYQKPTDSTGIYSPQHDHVNGNDGDINMMFHSSAPTALSWWQVDLQRLAIIIDFHYHPRPGYPNRILPQPYDIFVMTKPLESSDFQTCSSITADDFVDVTHTKPYVFSCMKHTKARFIRLQKHDNATFNHLVFSELKVCGMFIQ